MKPHSSSSEGIILSRKNINEADRIISLFSRSNGRTSLIAKGIRRPSSRKRGHLDAFNYIKYLSIAGHGMDIMTEAEVIEDFSQIKKSLKKISLAYYIMEVVGKITHEGEPNIELFNLVLNTLRKLKTTKELKELRLDFVTELLKILGYYPQDQKLLDPDQLLEEVVERKIASVRVGKIMLK